MSLRRVSRGRLGQANSWHVLAIPSSPLSERCFVKTAFWIVVLTAISPTVAHGAFVLDFENFRVEDAQLHDQPGQIDLGGFRLLSIPPPGNAFRFVTAGTLHPLFPGSTALFNGQSNAEIVLTAIDGSPFSIYSIDLAVLPPGANDPAGPFDPGPFEINFVATTPSGGTKSQSFTINHSFLALERVFFSGFENVTSVRWLQGTGFNPPGPPGPTETPTHQFDNIHVAAVPEPSSSVLIGTGFSLVAVRLASRRRAHHRAQALS